MATSSLAVNKALASNNQFYNPLPNKSTSKLGLNKFFLIETHIVTRIKGYNKVFAVKIK